MEIKTILFDFDGTLADTLPSSFAAFRYVFEKYDDRTLDDEEIVKMFGPIEDKILRDHLNNQECIEEAIDDYYAKYDQEHNREFEKLDEIKDLLNHLKELELNIGIVTGKSRRALTISLELLEIYNYFDVTITGDEVKKPKPDPEGIQKCLGLLHNSTDEVIFVGDSETDIKAGMAANVRTVAAQWFSTVQTTKFEIEPNKKFDSIHEFLSFVEEHVKE